MIKIKLKESNSQEVDLSEITTSPIVIEKQLDTALDSGTIKYLMTEPNEKKLNESLAGYSIRIDYNTENNNKIEKFDFVGMDSRALVRRGGLATRTITDRKTKVGNNPAGYYYDHYVGGVIDVPIDVVEIIGVWGSAGTPQAQYSEGKISWSAHWKSVGLYKDPYIVTISYSYLSNSKGIYSHQVALIEPSKLLQGVMIDGFGVSQPEDYSSRKTLLDVVNKLLSVTPFDCQRFTLAQYSNVINALSAVKSPEFKWNTQTSLWECLLQVGAVIDAMPRLIADINGKFTVVTFDFVNAYVDEVDSIYDDATNVLGENVNEQQYNTALSSVVENLRESD